MSQNNELQELDPDDALELYIQTIETEKSQATIYSHDSRLSHFTRWCSETGVTNMNTLTGRDLHEFKLWRRDDGDINKVTEKTQMDTLRVFIRFCESIDAVTNDLSEKVLSPNLDDGDNVRDVMLDPEVADKILSWLDQYRYASNEHVCLTLMWRCLLRRGGVRALDAADFDPDEKSLHVQHQPDTGTPLKNKDSGERHIALRDDTATLLSDYLASPGRADVTDENGREPLLTTVYGRPHVMTIASWVYGVTRPCTTTGDCPHGRVVDECDAAQRREDASKCPSTVSAHAVRRGAITNWLSADVPATAVGDRANSDPETLAQHYDQRSSAEKMEQRRRYLDRFDV